MFLKVDSEVKENEEIRCLEFFSGMGGLHCALNLCGIRAKIVEAFDVNPHANACYKLNFGQAPNTTTIERLSLASIKRYKAQAWLLSPPCQPYTQGGSKRDEKDTRAAALHHLIYLLTELSESQPQFIFLENVPGFETSKSREKLIDVLIRGNYFYEEFMVSPKMLNIPNDRLRYYLLAVKQSNLVPCEKSSKDLSLQCSIPLDCMNQWAAFLSPPELRGANSISLMSFLREIPPIIENEEINFVPHEVLRKPVKFRFDIAHPAHLSSSVFTKAYGSNHVYGSGPFLQTKELSLTTYALDDPDALCTLGLRYFQPLEIAKLHGFYNSKNECFSFPSDLTIRQCYSLLGNSLNVYVVALLFCRLFGNESHAQ